MAGLLDRYPPERRIGLLQVDADISPFPAEDAIINKRRAAQEIQRIFGETVFELRPEEVNNAYAMVLKNFGKFRDDPLSDDWIREHATNPSGRLLTLFGQEL